MINKRKTRFDIEDDDVETKIGKTKEEDVGGSRSNFKKRVVSSRATINQLFRTFKRKDQSILEGLIFFFSSGCSSEGH